MGYALIKLEHYDEAEDALRTAIELDPDYAVAQINLAYALIELGRHDEAVDALRTATKLGPDCAAAYANLGYALIELGRHDEAVDALRTATKLDPDCAATHGNLGHTLNQLDRYDEAEDALRTAIGLDPTLPYPHRILAEVNLRRHPAATDAALSHLKDAFDRAGKDTKEPFLFSLYEIIKEFSSPVEAQETLRQWSEGQAPAP